MINYSERLDRVFQALADSTRRDMVERLIRGPASVSQLAEPLAMSLPAVMQHIQVLLACGLVRSEKAGRVRTCHIEPGALRLAEDWIGQQRTAWERHLDQLGGYLADPPGPPGHRPDTSDHLPDRPDHLPDRPDHLPDRPDHLPDRPDQLPDTPDQRRTS
jgi:DNA-binding transcriptional ArsR family regulator